MADEIHPWSSEWGEPKPFEIGGQGDVSKVHHRTDPSRIAILKRIVDRWKDDPQARDRLRQEAEALIKLHKIGAHVPEVFDSILNHEAAEPFILMEFIRGLRFDEWLKTSAPISPNDAVTVTERIADIIKLCHEANIGHRDLKPANIILKGGDINQPYVLDFGISFDSKQTAILTKRGEIFRNEFIALPECQDLEGGHRDLRSDITALAGIFFNCLTGKAPIVLLDAQQQPPHRRHELLLNRCATAPDEGERLAWFFAKAFTYPIAERFQTLDRFRSELSQFSASSPARKIDLMEQYRIFDETARSMDRSVQMGALGQQYSKIINELAPILTGRLNAADKLNGKLNVTGTGVNAFGNELPSVAGASLFENGPVYYFALGREHFQKMAVAVIVGFAVGMEIHIYAAATITEVTNHAPIHRTFDWQKVVVIESPGEALPNRKIEVVSDAIESLLGREIRKMAQGVSTGQSTNTKASASDEVMIMLPVINFPDSHTRAGVHQIVRTLMRQNREETEANLPRVVGHDIPTTNDLVDFGERESLFRRDQVQMQRGVKITPFGEQYARANGLL
jgi:serine/threonine protein kinase